MKKTFKTLIAVGLCALALQSQAAQYHAQSFLNVQSLVLTNTLNPTNLVTAGSVQTNIVGLIFTNQNTRTIVSATDGSRVNPFKDVSLWVRNDGSPPYNIAATNTGLAQLSDATISVSWTAGSGADTAIPFVVTPIYAKTALRPLGREATASAEDWTFALTPVVSTVQTLSTNVPLWRWPGAAGLRIKRAVNTDATAAGHVTVDDISLNGFVP